MEGFNICTDCFYKAEQGYEVYGHGIEGLPVIKTIQDDGGAYKVNTGLEKC